MNRRTFIKSSSLFMSSVLLKNNSFAASTSSQPLFHMPDESHPHERTWMAFVANDLIWSRRQIPEVKRNLAFIAKTIAKYEPVSILVNPSELKEAKAVFKGKFPFKIEIVECKIDDLWLRDTGPVFVKSTEGKKIAIDFNFNGWGNKQEHSKDKKVARHIARHSGSVWKKSSLTLEGGCFEVDGKGTAIMTKSCILNANRNPGLSQIEAETELKELLGLKKIIWLEGIKGKDVTDGHTDFYARFIKPGEVMVSRENDESSYDYAVTRENIKILKKSTDAWNQPLKLHIIDAPEIFNERFGVEDFAAGYIGYYVCNNAVIAQKFGDQKADEKAKVLLQKLFPNRVIEQIAIDGIASGGGSIHCATQQEIKI